MTSKLPFLAATAVLAGFAPMSAQQGEGSVPVTASSGIESLTIDGQLRFRADQRDPITPVKGMEADSSQFARLRLGFGAQLDSNNSAYLQLQESVHAIGDGQGRATMSSVHQAFGRMNDLFGLADAQVGRFEMKYGNQRMVSPLDWSNTGRAWDGVRIARAGQDYSFDVFSTQPVAGQGASTRPMSGLISTEDQFHGVYFEYGFGVVELDLYGFHRTRQVNGGGWADDTFGFLVEADHGALDWEVEFATQTGDHGAFKAAGKALAAGINFDLGGPTIGGGFEYASGRDGNDDRFVPLFHFGHAYNGHQDIVSWSNLLDLVFRSKFPINPDWNVHGDVHLLSRAENKDAVQFGGGAAGATTAAGTNSNIGTEVDLYLKGKMTNNVSVWTGVSAFSAGNAIATAKDQAWAFFQIVFSF